jgi:hypothetical protein
MSLLRITRKINERWDFVTIRWLIKQWAVVPNLLHAAIPSARLSRSFPSSRRLQPQFGCVLMLTALSSEPAQSFARPDTPPNTSRIGFAGGKGNWSDCHSRSSGGSDNCSPITPTRPSMLAAGKRTVERWNDGAAIKSLGVMITRMQSLAERKRQPKKSPAERRRWAIGARA